MLVNRRVFSGSFAAFALAGCSGANSRAVSGGTDGTSLPDDLKPVSNRDYDAWVRGFRSRALQQGFSEELLSSAFKGTGYLPGVVTRDRNQTEFSRTLEDYLSITVSDERVSKGRAALVRHQPELAAIERSYSVDRHIITAIWGIESAYGERRGDVPVVSATSTLAYDGRRGRFFESQLVAALRILRAGDTSPEALTGSWAGAMGHTQFIPTSYLSFAVDFTGDGRRDVWSDNPSDALASTASYLSGNGWQAGLSWGGEVGNGAPRGTVIEPQPGGPRFATTSNFQAIKRYNNSDAYAIAVGHLADRIAGAPPLQTPFPPDANGMTKTDRMALQRGLTARGFDTGGADGVVGARTREAIAAFQVKEGLPATGEPSLALTQRLN